MRDARLIIVSNRLPVTVRAEGGDVQVIKSAGGLATGLSGPHQRSEGLWLGWPGDVSRLDEAQRAALEARLAEMRCVPIFLSQEEASRFYDGYSNGVLWPLFHYLLGQIPTEVRDFDAYTKVNERFADAVAERYQPGDLVWVHDYQLCLLPGMLRKRVPDARIGFFLHIPFPSTDVFGTLAERDAILEGLLGADLVGFHTHTYQRNFATSLLRILGIEAQIDSVVYDGREVRLGVYPMGIDAAEFRRIASDPQVVDEARAIRAQANGAKILLGVDRLDYTKGIPRRLLAMERLLEREPALRGRVRLVQIAVPSRTSVPEYADFRRRVEEEVGRINGAYGTVSWSPIQYIFRSISPRHLVALYRAADVMLVTPLRDGMNLVAKEFVACREDEDGVLVLSEFAGAAAELGDALLVNPYDIEQVARAVKTALSMPPAERTTRMRGLRKRVLSYDVHTWVNNFVADLAPPPGAEPAPRELAGGVAQLTMRLVQLAQREEPIHLLLDYDGTLVPFAAAPQLAAPDDDLLALLRALAARPKTRLHLVSGRTRESLEEWFGTLDAGLHAEHGFWSRADPSAPWVAAGELPGEWMTKAKAMLVSFAERTPGAFVEQKTASIAWHYRLADPEFGALQAKELRLHLANALANSPIEVLVGNKVVEVRPHGISKAAVARAVTVEARGGAMLAMGDDRTDEEMFAALGEDALTVHVGRGASRARYRVPNPQAARAVLRALVA